MTNEAALDPQRIKEIRKSLGLSQVEAGNLIGGGPKAFGKYESGAIKPAASVENILKILEAEPTALKFLKGSNIIPFEHLASKPLEVSGDHVSVLSPDSFPALVRRMLSAEALINGLSLDGLHVAAKITISDDGEDARITWKDGPTYTKFLSNRLNQFQLKAGPIDPAEAGKDVLRRDGSVKPEVAYVLKDGGTYTMLCAHSYSYKQIRARITAIIDSLRKAGATFNDEQISFRDADQIATWINQLPGVSSWLLEKTRPGMIGPLRPWSYWAENPEHNIQHVEDERLDNLREFLREKYSKKRSVTRVFGFSGVGKSRLILESLAPTKIEDESSIQLSDLVLYADEQMVGAYQLKSVIQSLADSSYRAIIIVNRCTIETQQDLAALVKRGSSELSLVTIHDEVPQENIDNDTIIIPVAHNDVIEKMIKNICPETRLENHQRLVKRSLGYPKVAALIGQTWLKDKTIDTASEDLVERIVSGGKHRQPTYMKVARILSVFGAVGAKSPLDSELAEIVNFSQNISADDLRVEIEELAVSGITQKKGRMIVVNPRPLALQLAKMQWCTWSPTQWDEVIAGKLSIGLRIRAANQLALLNTTSIALEVTKSLCRVSGPLDSIEKIHRNGHSKVLPILAEIDAEATLLLLEHLISELSEDELNDIAIDCRRSFVRTLEIISFSQKTFERGAGLLLTLAESESDSVTTNATAQFKSLFPHILADTSSDGETRLRFIDSELKHSRNSRRIIIANALIEGCKPPAIRMLGSESHGSRPALESWHPNRKEAGKYVSGCVDRLIILAKENTPAGNAARKGLGQHLHDLIQHDDGLELVEKIVFQMLDVCKPYWSDALESLSYIMLHTKKLMSSTDSMRVMALINKLKPSNLQDQVRYLVSEMPWNFPCEEDLDFDIRSQRQLEAVENLVKDMLKIDGSIESQLKHLSSGTHKMSAVFGRALAKFSKSNELWYPHLIKALEDVDTNFRNFDLLSGYLAGLSYLGKNECTNHFKQMAVKSVIFAPALPLVCWQIGIFDTDIPLICEAIKSNLLEPCKLRQWILSSVFSKLTPKAVTPLLDTLLEMDAMAYTVALELFGMYVHGQNTKIDSLIPQVHTVASKIPVDGIKNSGVQMAKYHFEQIMSRVLDKGIADVDAQRLALALSKKLIGNYDSPTMDLIQPLVPKLLGNFSEIIWPLFGHAITSDQKIRWHFEHMLRNIFALSDMKKPAILKVPENMLFAWCHAHPDIAPAFVATIVPALTAKNEENTIHEFHPIFKRLLDEFGERKDLLDSATRNIYTFGWHGSRTQYYSLYEPPLKNLENHSISQVRAWAQRTLGQLNLEKENAHNRDEEDQVGWKL